MSDADSTDQSCSNWRTALKSYTMLAAPMLLAALLAGAWCVDLDRRASRADAVADVVALSTKASALAHELQRERGMSAGFVGSEGAAFRTELEVQRQDTDAVLADVRGALLASVSPDAVDAAGLRVRRIGEALERLAAERAAIDKLATSTKALVGFYTGVVVDLLSLADDPLRQGGDGSVAARATAYQAVLMAKEFAGRERAAGSVGFGSGAFSTKTFSWFVSLQARQAYLLDRVRRFGDVSVTDRLDAIASAPAATRLNALRAVAEASMANGDLEGVTGPAWFKASSAYLADLRGLESFLAEDILGAARAESGARRALSIQVAIGAALLLALIGGWGGVVTWRMNRDMRGVAHAIRRIQRGEEKVDVPGCARSDEVGVIARTLTHIADAGSRMLRVKEAVECASTPILLLDRDGLMLFANPAFEEFWIDNATTLNALAERSGDWRSFKALRDAIDAVDGPILSYNGREYAARRRPVIGARGEDMGSAVEIRDITTERRIEAQIEAVIEAVRAGDLSHRITEPSNRAFLNHVVGGLNAICASIDGFMVELGDVLAGLAGGDLRKRVETDYQGRFGEAALNVNDTIARLNVLVRDIQETGRALDGSIDAVASGSVALSGRAESQASSLEETTATMEEMAATIAENAEHAHAAARVARDAENQSSAGRDVVSQAVASMVDIEASATEITDVISVIDSIAFQTNLLALNAAVEAARAGDAGKGFAVVASEVRTLAQRSAEAARGIKSMISSSTDKIAQGVGFVRASGEALTGMADIVRELSDAAENIARASAEQSTGVAETTSAVSAMDSITQANAGLAEESAATARALADQAERLAGLIAFFKTEGGAAAPLRQAS